LILRLIKFPYFADITERGDSGRGGVKAVPIMTGQRAGDFTDNSNKCHTFDEFAAKNIFRSCVYGLYYPLQVLQKCERVSEVSDVAKSECCEVAAVCS
jgi:hypothetical protein